MFQNYAGLGGNVQSALDELALRTISERGKQTNTTNSIVPGTIGGNRLTVNQTLSRSDYNFGYALLWINPNIVLNTLARRQIFVVFTTDGSQCVGQSTDRQRTDFSPAPGQNYYVTNWPQHVYAYRDDARVSSRRYQIVEATNNTSLEQVRINGTNLEFIWHNSGFGNQNIRINYEWRVFRIDDL